MSVVIVAGGAGSRALVDTADSAARQGTPVEIVLALTHPGYPPGIVESIANRLHASAVYAESAAAAVNKAVARAGGKYILLLRAPWRLDRGTLETCASALDAAPDNAVLIPALRLQSPDGRALQTIDVRPTLPSILAEPRATPPVVALRRTAWLHAGGLDESAGELANCDWWLRVLGASLPVVTVDGPQAVLIASGTDWWPPFDAPPFDSGGYRRVLEKHAAFLERNMTRVLVEREVAFGRLMEEHRQAVRRRDESLRELEEVRARTAHHQAYLDHHGRGAIEWGDLRRGDPVSREWGYDRGVPIDRYYIEAFLAAHSSDIGGVVLEVQEDDFTRRFGGPRTTESDVIDLDDANSRATIVADLRDAAGVEGARFDCVILTQTLHVIDDMPAAIRECYRLLKPDGVLLATLPCASRICLEYGPQGDLWRVTPAGARALFEPVFGVANVDDVTYGSVLTNVAFLHGLACGELTDSEFAQVDRYHPVLVGVRAQKREPAAVSRADGPVRPSSASAQQGIVLLYHRVDEHPDVHDLSVPAALLEEQLRWLAEHCHVMPLEDLLAAARVGLPPRAVAITFDDGYLDTLEVAAPALQRLGLPATVFATSRWLNEPGEYWWDVLERTLLGGPVPTELSVEASPALVFAMRTAEERRAAHDRLHAHLVHAGLEERERIVAQIARWAGDKASVRRRPVTASELRRLAGVPGISIGAHSVNHLALPDQPADVQRSEIVECVTALEQVVGRPVNIFAYPYGAVDRATSDAARALCRWSMGCDAAPVGRSFDAARVPRVEVKRWDAATLARQLERYVKSEGMSRPTSPSPA